MHSFVYGVPALIGDDFSRCNPEVYAFEDGINGVTFEDGDPTSLAEKIVGLLGDEKTLTRLSEGAKRTATEVTTLDRFVDGYTEAIEFATSTKPKNRLDRN